MHGSGSGLRDQHETMYLKYAEMLNFHPKIVQLDLTSINKLSHLIDSQATPFDLVQRDYIARYLLRTWDNIIEYYIKPISYLPMKSSFEAVLSCILNKRRVQYTQTISYTPDRGGHYFTERTGTERNRSVTLLYFTERNRLECDSYAHTTAKNVACALKCASYRP